MSTVQHDKLTSESTAPSVTISFRCDRDWKRKVASVVALRGLLLQDVCVEALSRYLEIDRPGDVVELAK